MTVRTFRAAYTTVDAPLWRKLGLGGKSREELHRALILPEDCRVMDTSDQALKAEGKVVIRLEGSRFPETAEAQTMPYVDIAQLQGRKTQS